MPSGFDCSGFVNYVVGHFGFSIPRPSYLIAEHHHNSQDAVMMMIADKLPELVKTQVEAIKNLKIDKITVWDNMGSGKDGKSPTSANFLSGMLGSIPPFEELFKMAGMELPNYLKGKSIEQSQKDNATDAEEVK